MIDQDFYSRPHRLIFQAMTRLSNAGNRDHYSRLDLVFPQIKQWLAADPVRENSSQPLVRSAGAVAQGQGARTSQATSATLPATATGPAVRERPGQVTPLRSGTLER